MRIIFFGTSSFALDILDALGESIHHVPAVVTRPRKKAGRGRRPKEPPVAAYALEKGFSVLQPDKLTEEFIMDLRQLKPDLMVSAAYGAWLPELLLSSAPLGVVNVHPSLLPLYRGAAPVARAVLDGVDETGVTFMLTDSGWDTGPVLECFKEKVLPGDTRGTLEHRLAVLAADRIIGVLEAYSEGSLVPKSQSGEAIYADKLSPEESWLDWRESAESLERKVRAFQPSPGARTMYSGRLLKIVRASLVSSLDADPGEVVLKGGSLLVGCGRGGLEILRIQPESKRVMDVRDYLRGSGMKNGEKLGSK